MSGWSPNPVPRKWLLGLSIAAALVVVYAVVVLQRIRFVLLAGLVLFVGYFLWRFVRAVEAIADALQRIADDRVND